MYKNDIWIREMGEKGMISPFEPELIREVDDVRIISYGVSSSGYDIRLSSIEFLVYKDLEDFPDRNVEGDPKDFNPDLLKPLPLLSDKKGTYFLLAPYKYGLGVAYERLNIPNNIRVDCIGKSTLARCAIIANLTPAEPGWKGYLTLELFNASGIPWRIYTNEGIVQLLFAEIAPCAIDYEKRQGKYQNQPEMVVFPRV